MSAWLGILVLNLCQCWGQKLQGCRIDRGRMKNCQKMATTSAEKMSEWLDGNWFRNRGASWKPHMSSSNTTECPQLSRQSSWRRCQGHCQVGNHPDALTLIDFQERKKEKQKQDKQNKTKKLWAAILESNNINNILTRERLGLSPRTFPVCGTSGDKYKKLISLEGWQDTASEASSSISFSLLSERSLSCHREEQDPAGSPRASGVSCPFKFY